jgi:hypothetical protein
MARPIPGMEGSATTSSSPTSSVRTRARRLVRTPVTTPSIAALWSRTVSSADRRQRVRRRQTLTPWTPSITPGPPSAVRNPRVRLPMRHAARVAVRPRARRHLLARPVAAAPATAASRCVTYPNNPCLQWPRWARQPSAARLPARRRADAARAPAAPATSGSSPARRRRARGIPRTPRAGARRRAARRERAPDRP